MIRTEISGAEIAEEMEKERRFFQLQMCEVINTHVQDVPIICLTMVEHHYPCFFFLVIAFQEFIFGKVSVD